MLGPLLLRGDLGKTSHAVWFTAILFLELLLFAVLRLHGTEACFFAVQHDRPNSTHMLVLRLTIGEVCRCGRSLAAEELQVFVVGRATIMRTMARSGSCSLK